MNACKRGVLFKVIPCIFTSVNSIAGKLFEKGKFVMKKGKGAFKCLFYCLKLLIRNLFIDYV